MSNKTTAVAVLFKRKDLLPPQGIFKVKLLMKQKYKKTKSKNIELIIKTEFLML